MIADIQTSEVIVGTLVGYDLGDSGCSYIINVLKDDGKSEFLHVNSFVNRVMTIEFGEQNLNRRVWVQKCPSTECSNLVMDFSLPKHWACCYGCASTRSKK